MRATVGWGVRIGRTSVRVARERLGERESTRGSDRREIASEIGGVAVEGRRRGGGRESTRGGLHRARVGRGPHPERVARRAGATRGGRGRIRRSGRGGPVVQRAEFLRAVRHGRQDSRVAPPIHRNVRWRQAAGDDAPDAPHGSKGTSARGAARSASPAAVSRACASRRRVRRTRSVTCARSAARRPPRARRAASRPASWHRLAARAGFISVRIPRAETAGREALIECSDAPGRS